MPTSRTVETRRRILAVALDVLGQDPDASMTDVATAAGVVRRTVYGHFPSRSDLVLAIAEQAAAEVRGVLAAVASADRAADEIWSDFVACLWPLARRYRVLLTLRRSEHGAGIHALLAPVDEALADLVRRGQDDGALGEHLPALVLGQLAYATVFTVAETALTDDAVTVASAITTSLLVLGVPADRAAELARGG